MAGTKISDTMTERFDKLAWGAQQERAEPLQADPRGFRASQRLPCGPHRQDELRRYAPDTPVRRGHRWGKVARVLGNSRLCSSLQGDAPALGQAHLRA